MLGLYIYDRVRVIWGIFNSPHFTSPTSLMRRVGLLTDNKKSLQTSLSLSFLLRADYLTVGFVELRAYRSSPTSPYVSLEVQVVGLRISLIASTVNR